MTAVAPILTPAAPALTVLTLTALTVAAGDHVQTLPFSALRRSTLNPRKAFDEASLTELAQNIYERTGRDEQGRVTSSGIMQNLLARPTADGYAELAAGERRFRAVELLVGGLTIPVRVGTDPNGLPVMGEAFIQVPADYPVPVLVQEMTDAELTEAATVENIQRDDMSPMEEADAFMALRSAGRSEDYIALKFGLSPVTVRQRIQLAAGLGKEGRKLLDQGVITLEAAKVIAGTSGELKKLVLERARNRASADTLKHLVRHAGFMVENAIFDVQASGLNIELSLLGDMPAKFSNPRAALDAQVAALEALKAQQEATGEWKEVVVVGTDDEQASLPQGEWTQKWSLPYGFKERSLVLAYSVTTGRVQQHPDVARKSDVKAYEQSVRGNAGSRAQTVGSTSTGSGVREAAHVIGHQTRCMALDAYHAANPKATLALACLSLIQRAQHLSHTALMGLKTDSRKEAPFVPETVALAAQIVRRFPMFAQHAETGLLTAASREEFTADHVHDALTHEDVTEADLTLIFAYFTHRTVGEWTISTNRPSRELNAYAKKVGAAEEVQRRFTLTPEFLNAFKAADLGVMVQTMPDSARPAYKHGCSKKDMVGAIMEKAGALALAGWAPEIVQFCA